MLSQIFVFKISLNGTMPMIWRRIHVPATYNFYQLSTAIQQSMGWAGYHSHLFEMVHPKSRQQVTLGVRDLLTLEQSIQFNPMDENVVRISSYFTSTNFLATYTYDFGSDWEHTILFEGKIDMDPDVELYPICVDGEGHCPPEDCGGLYQYYRLIEAINQPLHADHDEMMKWTLRSTSGNQILSGEPFDPNKVVFAM